MVANANLSQENEGLLKQLRLDKEMYTKKIDFLKEENVEIEEDLRGLTAKNKALKHDYETLGEKAKQVQAKLDARINQENDTILGLRADAKLSSSELLHLRAVERKYILEQDKNVEKSTVVEKLEVEAKRHQSELGRSKAVEDMLAAKTQICDEPAPGTLGNTLYSSRARQKLFKISRRRLWLSWGITSNLRRKMTSLSIGFRNYKAWRTLWTPTTLQQTRLNI